MIDIVFLHDLVGTQFRKIRIYELKMLDCVMNIHEFVVYININVYIGV